MKEFTMHLERIGCFVANRAMGKPVFNLALGLQDSWGK